MKNISQCKENFERIGRILRDADRGKYKWNVYDYAFSVTKCIESFPEGIDILMDDYKINQKMEDEISGDCVGAVYMEFSEEELKKSFSEFCDEQREKFGFDQDEMDKRCGFFNRFVDWKFKYVSYMNDPDD